MKELIDRISSRRAAVGVVGLGYVGLGAAACLAGAGFRVVGVDLAAERVRAISRGELPTGGVEPGLAALLEKVTAEKTLLATTEHAVLADCDVILVAVETPVSSDGRARFTALRRAIDEIGRVMRPGALVIVESTVSPGTCDALLAPALAAASGRADGVGFFLGHCPQRVMPGRLLENLRTMPRACGAASADVREAMIALYRTFTTARLDACDLVTAEIVKTAENTWRDVNIAFANELALVCEAAGADFTEVRALVERIGDRTLLVAGPGVGGKCIPKDPWLFAQGAQRELPLVRAARAVNEGMPLHVATLVEDALAETGADLAGATVAVLGVAYREDTDVVDHSPAEALARALEARGATLRLHDPYVAAHAGDLWAALDGADAAVLMCAHAPYRDLDLARAQKTMRRPVLVDARHAIRRDHAREHGFVFRGLGRGTAR